MKACWQQHGNNKIWLTVWCLSLPYNRIPVVFEMPGVSQGIMESYFCLPIRKHFLQKNRDLVNLASFKSLVYEYNKSEV